MKSLLFAFLFLCALSVTAVDNSSSGARSAALANASVTLGDGWAAFNNQAALAYLSKTTFGTSFENRFLLNELSTKNFLVAIPTSAGSFSLSGSMFGFNLYNEKKAGLAYAKKLGKKIAAGIQIDYLNTYINDEFYGSKTMFTVEGGLLAEPIKNLQIGFHLFNPNRTKLSEFENEPIPTIIRVGACYHFSEKVFWSVEEEKDIDQDGSFRSGIEYKVGNVFTLRTGVATNPTLFAFGFGIRYGKIALDAASTYHQVLGFSPCVSLNYEL